MIASRQVFVGALGFLALSLGLGLVNPAWARDLQGRLGVGYNSEFANSVVASPLPGFSIKYALSRDLALEAVVGSKTSSPTNTVTAAKLFKNLFLETICGRQKAKDVENAQVLKFGKREEKVRTLYPKKERILTITCFIQASI